MASSQILSGFNNHFFDFLDDIIRVFPDNLDIQTCKNTLVMIRKANPKIIIKIWKTHVVDRYGEKIDEGDLEYFINKDYSSDVAETGNIKTITDAIDKVRKPLQHMSKDEKEKTLKYLQNLKKLCCLYSENI